MQYKLIALVVLVAFVQATCLAENVTQVGRYLTVTNKPIASQTDLLSQIVQVRFPQKIQTVGEAVTYLLRFSGCSLAPDNQRDRALKITLSKPLPVVDREIGPVTLKQALMILVGNTFDLKINPVQRLVNFKLKPAYQKYVS